MTGLKGWNIGFSNLFRNWVAGGAACCLGAVVMLFGFRCSSSLISGARKDGCVRFTYPSSVIVILGRYGKGMCHVFLSKGICCCRIAGLM